MATKVIRPKSKEDWLQLRTQGIGSSEIASVVGLNPFETPYQLWRKKKGFEQPKEETFAMKAGHYLEDAVSKFWEDETGKKVIKRSAPDWIIQDVENPYLRVSPDRTYWIDEGYKSEENKGILECKTTQKEIDGDDLPKHWFCQVQYQLGVSGKKHGSIAWLTKGREFGYRDIELVPDFYEWLKEEATKFYTEYMIGGKEPEAINTQDVVLKYTKHKEGKVIEVGEDTYLDYSHLKEVRNKILVLERNKEELEEKIKFAFKDAEAITYNGTTLATWKSPKSSQRFDVKSFEMEYPDLSKMFMRESVGARRFLLK